MKKQRKYTLLLFLAGFLFMVVRKYSNLSYIYILQNLSPIKNHQ